MSGGVSASFAYDALGRRIAKTIGANNTGFFYNGGAMVPLLEALADANGNLTTQVHLTGGVSATCGQQVAPRSWIGRIQRSRRLARDTCAGDAQGGASSLLCCLLPPFADWLQKKVLAIRRQLKAPTIPAGMVTSI
ncbi:MAG TPA: hypothetical protein VI685_17355 [Candidatus Angelobacter sp.]